MILMRVLLGFSLAVLVATALASLAHTQIVLAGLEEAGSPAPMEVRVATSLGDLAGLAPALGPVVAIAFAVGFGAAAIARRVLRPLAPVAFPIAGAASMAMALAAMKLAYDGVTPLASARTPVGFAILCLAGAIGGLVFQAVLGRHRA